MYFYSGTDRVKARAALDAEVKKIAKGARVDRVSDSHALADLEAALRGPGMFDPPGGRAIVLDGVLENDEMRPILLDALPALGDSNESFFMLEGKLDADTRRRVEKYAERSQRFDAPGKKKDGSIFGIAMALRKNDRKALWVGYQRELQKGAAPEQIHGVLFWGAKTMFLQSRGERERSRAKKIIAELAELPHESRRRGEELEYALERFVLSGA